MGGEQSRAGGDAGSHGFSGAKANASSPGKTMGSGRLPQCLCLAHARRITQKLRGKQVLKCFAGPGPGCVQPDVLPSYEPGATLGPAEH